MSIDGFVAGPNREKDWLMPSMSSEGQQWVLKLLEQAGLHALGHQTFRELSDYWPTSTNPIAKPMNSIPKAVFSRGSVMPKDGTSEKGSWSNPITAGADFVADVERLKAESGKPIVAHGGAQFASSLIAAGLVDVYHLVVHPVALGCGLPIFGEIKAPLQLKLEDVVAFESGVTGRHKGLGWTVADSGGPGS